MVMYGLLRHFPKNSLVLVTKHQDWRTSSDDRRLDVKTVKVAKAGACVYPTLFQLLLMSLTFFEILLATRRTSPRVILSVFPSLDFLVCSILVGRIVDIPVVVYLHDCILETAGNVVERILSRKAEVWTFSKTSGVYSISEPMKSFYGEKGLQTDVLPHGLDLSELRRVGGREPTMPIRVGSSGGIYENNIQAMSDLLRAKESSEHPFEVHITSTAQSIELLKNRGLIELADTATTLPTRSAVLGFLVGCDLLFVPMSFESKVRGDLLTVFPTKVTDYWLAGRPILVYGPRDCAFVSMAERDGYAVVVTERSLTKLAEAISNLAISVETGERLVSASRIMAHKHDGSLVADKHMNDLETLRAKD